MDCSPPGSYVRGILQARILEWVAISFSRGSSQPRDEPESPTFQADSLLSEPLGKMYNLHIYINTYVDFSVDFVCMKIISRRLN